MTTAPDDDALDAVFFALASEPRRRILDVLKREGGCNVNRVAEHFDGELTRFAVMKHLAALEQAGDADPVDPLALDQRVQRLLGRAPDATEVRRRGRRDPAPHPEEERTTAWLNRHRTSSSASWSTRRSSASGAN
jgi:predicted ArsR family transcriptional regulator